VRTRKRRWRVVLAAEEKESATVNRKEREARRTSSIVFALHSRALPAPSGEKDEEERKKGDKDGKTAPAASSAYDSSPAASYTLAGWLEHLPAAFSVRVDSVFPLQRRRLVRLAPSAAP
jgi:hypothetical protein